MVTHEPACASRARTLHAELAGIFMRAPAAEWESQLSSAGLPCGMVRDVAEAVSLPALEERRLKIEMDIPALPDRSDVAIVNAGFIMSEDGPDVSDPPPLHGQHTEEVLSSLGFSEEQRRAIRTSPRSSS
jgi:CoA:oxalate CoA-transferase